MQKKINRQLRERNKNLVLTQEKENNNQTLEKITGHPPNPEVSEKAVRRTYSAKYKIKILKEIDSNNEPGHIGSLLRSEGLYSSHLTKWRREREAGILKGLSPKQRGPQGKKNDPNLLRISILERDKERLSRKLKQAELIISAQKKISELLQISTDLTKVK